VSGIPIVAHVYRAARDAGTTRTIVVVGRNGDLVQEILGSTCEYVEQSERLGTGHACQQAERLLVGFPGTVVVLMGDAPLVTSETLAGMLSEHESRGAVATILTARPADVRGLGRIVRDREGRFVGIVEERDATPEQKAIGEINAGFYCFSAPQLFSALKKIDNNNVQGEYLLTDVFPHLAKQGDVHTVELQDFTEAVGINDRKWLSEAESVMQKRIKDRLMMEGVTIVDPSSTYIEHDVVVGQDSVIHPFTSLKGRTRVGLECQIGPGSTLIDADIGDGTVVLHSVVQEASVGKSCQVGPFAHLRPETDLADEIRIGNFVEIKKSQVGERTKISHLAYVGDAHIGKDVNIGAGTIFVNYDGVKKHITTVEDESFVGCNSNLIAPVRLGKGSYIAAGSTINRDVPAQALAIARSRQENKEGWTARKNK
jgi:bifunctional UDP-N-acetylglucosamine pyrophosphorylase/glucosamine-1-phosphate N-acetyltransferase